MKLLMPVLLGVLCLGELRVALSDNDAFDSDGKTAMLLRLRVRLLPELIGVIPSETVQRELNLEPEMKERLDDLVTRFALARKAFFKEKGVSSGVELWKNFSNETARFHATFEAQLRTVLTVEQIERVQQFYLQQRGSNSLREPEIAQWLGLSKAQLAKLQVISSESAVRQRTFLEEWRQTADRSRKVEFDERRRKIDAERNAKAIEILKHEQRAKFADVIGKPVGSPKPAITPAE